MTDRTHVWPFDEFEEKTCPGCDLPEADWPETDGQKGVVGRDGEVYCTIQCALANASPLSQDSFMDPRWQGSRPGIR